MVVRNRRNPRLGFGSTQGTTYPVCVCVCAETGAGRTQDMGNDAKVSLFREKKELDSSHIKKLDGHCNSESE